MRIGILGLSLVVLLCGCGSKPKTLEGLKPVKGKVTYKGQPLTKGTITFVTDDRKGVNAMGVLDEKGEFTLNSDVNSPGARPGKYQVRVESWLTESSMGDGKFTPGKAAIPDKYMAAGTSGLDATVKDQSDVQMIDFDLKD